MVATTSGTGGTGGTGVGPIPVGDASPAGWTTSLSSLDPSSR